MTGVQDGDLASDRPQPLGVLCNARTYPNRNSTSKVVFKKGLALSKSGLLVGAQWRATRCQLAGGCVGAWPQPHGACVGVWHKADTICGISKS